MPKGIIAPKFVFPHVIESSKNILKGAPFSAGKDSTLLADFSRKVKAIDLAQDVKDQLMKDAINALNTLSNRVMTV